jgi:glycosyltransferase involved in cell wall biosynthesis
LVRLSELNTKGDAGLFTEHIGDVSRSSNRRYRIAMLAPPWAAVTPSGCRGVELAVSLLCAGLVDRGHQVTLFAASGTQSSAKVHEILPTYRANEIGHSLFETDHVARVLSALSSAAARGRPFDILHDHCGFTAIAMADRIPVPVVHTMHPPLSSKVGDLYAFYAEGAHLVATSEAQLAAAPQKMRVAGIVPNPVGLNDWPLQPDKQNYVVWHWRVEQHLQYVREVVDASRSAKVPLVLAGPIPRGQERWFHSEIAPYLNDQQVSYVGEVAGDRERRLIADARAVLIPPHSNEAYLTDIVHALASGTPVIAGEGGVAAEIVRDGVNGYSANDEEALAAAITALDQVDPSACRESAVNRHGIDAVVARYEAIYHSIAGQSPERRRAEVAGRGHRPSAMSPAPRQAARRPRQYRPTR